MSLLHICTDIRAYLYVYPLMHRTDMIHYMPCFIGQRDFLVLGLQLEAPNIRMTPSIPWKMRKKCFMWTRKGQCTAKADMESRLPRVAGKGRRSSSKTLRCSQKARVKPKVVFISFHGRE